MAERSIYEDIARRTGGDIYIGVVGPVRSGKSTFITRFMQEMVLPNITEDAARERARDEMPQSAAGRTVMTTEPKFVPDEAVAITMEDGTGLSVKMIDCVGYMIPEAMGGEENGSVRMVHTPWQEEAMPFAKAAEYGTRRVMCEHATIGMVVTNDGTVGELPRASFVEAEERIVQEMKELGKPFAVILNSAEPASPVSVKLAEDLEVRYGVPVALVSCLALRAQDIRGILGMILSEFPVTSVRFLLPPFVDALPAEHPIRRSLTEDICRLAGKVHRMGDVAEVYGGLCENENVEDIEVAELDMGTGCAAVVPRLRSSLYYDVLGECAGQKIENERELLALVRELAAVRDKYARVAKALECADNGGYGIVMPSIGDLRLEKPIVVKQNGGYGVRLAASAQSLHMIRADIRTEINPIVSTEQQSEEFVRNILAELETDPQKLWESNMFGKSLYELVSEGLHEKLAHIPDEARQKLSETLERIVNEGANGLICVLL